MWKIVLQGHVLSTAKTCSARYVTRRKYFSQPRSVMYSFATPAIKLKLVHQIGGELLIANHMDQSLWWANQKQGPALKSYLLHSFFCRCTALLRLVPATQLCWAKTIFLSQTGIGWDFFIHYCAGSHSEYRWRCSKVTTCQIVWTKCLTSSHFFLFGFQKKDCLEVPPI
jgi:hypothetical protein